MSFIYDPISFGRIFSSKYTACNCKTPSPVFHRTCLESPERLIISVPRNFPRNPIKLFHSRRKSATNRHTRDPLCRITKQREEFAISSGRGIWCFAHANESSSQTPGIRISARACRGAGSLELFRVSIIAARKVNGGETGGCFV